MLEFSASLFIILYPSYITISPELFDEIEQKWAPPDDPVFQLVPPTFEDQVSELYAAIGSPAVSSLSFSFWVIYVKLLLAFRNLPEDPSLEAALLAAHEGEVLKVDIIPGLRELRRNEDFIGAIPKEGDQDSSEGDIDSDDIDLRDFADFSD